MSEQLLRFTGCNGRIGGAVLFALESGRFRGRGYVDDQSFDIDGHHRKPFSKVLQVLNPGGGPVASVLVSALSFRAAGPGNTAFNILFRDELHGPVIASPDLEGPLDAMINVTGGGDVHPSENIQME